MGCNQSNDAVKSKGKRSLEETQRAEVKSEPVEVPHVFKSRYKLGDQLGEGAFSIVKAAYDRQSRQKVAVKIIKRTNLPVEDEVALRQEVQILGSLDHPNIVKCVDFFEEEKYFYVVMECLEGGELFDRIVQKTYYNEQQARDLVFILLSAIKYCHDRDVVHRDLKPENLLLTSVSDDADIKIADFGFAIKQHGAASLTTQCGTPGYVAPEILKNAKYGKPVDMWSIGVITFILLGGYPPFHDDNQKILFKKIKNCEYTFHPEYWSAVSEEAKDLIRKLLNPVPEQRFTADDALAHSWVQREANELQGRNLDANLEALKKFLAARKFKAAARAVMAIQRLNLTGPNANTNASRSDDQAHNAALQSSSTAADDMSLKESEDDGVADAVEQRPTETAGGGGEEDGSGVKYRSTMVMYINEKGEMAYRKGREAVYE